MSSPSHKMIDMNTVLLFIVYFILLFIYQPKVSLR